MSLIDMKGNIIERYDLIILPKARHLPDATDKIHIVVGIYINHTTEHIEMRSIVEDGNLVTSDRDWGVTYYSFGEFITPTKANEQLHEYVKWVDKLDSAISFADRVINEMITDEYARMRVRIKGRIITHLALEAYNKFTE